MRIVEMVLCGDVNNDIVALLNSHGARAFGVNGKDAQFVTAKPKDEGKWGLTGIIDHVNADVVHRLIDEKFIPVIAPIASDKETGHPGYNINADLAASKIAGAIGAKKVVFMTDTPGVLDADGKLLSSLTEERVEALKADGTIHGGMVPKVDACIEAIERGVQKAHIIDGRIEHAILLELFTEEGIGTQITL
jgi:acetylglutamate kinase